MNKIILKCRFCGKMIGEIEQTNLSQKITEADIIDSRCDLHEQQFGSYQEIRKLFDDSILTEGFEDLFTKADGKKDIFEAKLKVAVDKEIIRISKIK